MTSSPTPEAAPARAPADSLVAVKFPDVVAVKFPDVVPATGKMSTRRGALALDAELSFRRLWFDRARLELFRRLLLGLRSFRFPERDLFRDLDFFGLGRDFDFFFDLFREPDLVFFSRDFDRGFLFFFDFDLAGDFFFFP